MDRYDYLDNIEEPDEDELRELEEILNPEKLKLEYADNITENIDAIDIESMLDFSRSEKGYKRVALEKETNIPLIDLTENKAVVSHLQNHGIFTVDDILRRTRREISSYEFIGAKETDAIGEKLYFLDLTFADEKIYKCERCYAKFLGYKVQNENILCPVCHMLEKNEKCTYYIKTFLPNDYKKEFKEILLHIDSYVYDFENEEIVIKNSPDAISAITSYRHVIEKYAMENEDNLKWCFDIALSCVREADCNLRTSLKQRDNIDLDSYGMYIRNKYIHEAKKHHFWRVLAGSISVSVFNFISTICHPYYNYFNERLCQLLNDYDYIDIKKHYFERFSFIHDYTILLTQLNCCLTAKEVLKAIKCRIRLELGRGGFKEILVNAVKQVDDTSAIEKEWINFLNLLQKNGCCPYKKEYNQLIAIKETGILSEFTNMSNIDKSQFFNSVKQCIVEELGLTEADAQYMAECIYEAFIMKKK